MRTLFMGSQGADVVFLRCLLNKHGSLPALDEDGNFGLLARAAVVAFQRSHAPLATDGTVDASTWGQFGQLTERLH